ncbi:methyltransferase family protein, partial [Pseudomonadota bacterium]
IVLVLLIIALAEPNRISLAVGGAFIVLGQLIRLWATGHLRRDKEVTTSGPYAYVRDPLYLGRLLLLIGFCVAAWGNSLFVLIPGLGLFFLDYMPRKHRKEMARLENLFGESYRQYAAVTRSLLPRVTRYAQAQNRGWSFDLMWNENREQYFLLGVILITLAIVLNLNALVFKLFGS